MIPQQDGFPEQLLRVVRAFTTGGRDAAEKELHPLAYQPHDIPRRPSLSRSQQLTIFRRDGWVCRYCGGKTIFTPVMALLGRLFPDDFPYHPNWKGGHTHPAVIARSAVIDHIDPGSGGGSWIDPDNLATACWPCNARKGDLTLEQLGWTIRPIPEATERYGLTEYYAMLWETVGRPEDGALGHWARALAGVERAIE